MGIISTLRSSNIRFNPRPWLNQEPSVEETNIQPEINTTMVEDKAFVELHMKVAEKVDALIENMETGQGFDNWNQSEADSEKTVLKK